MSSFSLGLLASPKAPAASRTSQASKTGSGFEDAHRGRGSKRGKGGSDDGDDDDDAMEDNSDGSSDADSSSSEEEEKRVDLGVVSELTIGQIDLS